MALSQDQIRDLARVLSTVRNDTSDAFTGLRKELWTGLAPLLEAIANPSPPAPCEYSTARPASTDTPTTSILLG